MDEADVRRPSGSLLEQQCLDRSELVAPLSQRETDTVDVVCVDSALEGCCADADDAAERLGFLEEREEIQDEACAAVEDDS